MSRKRLLFLSLGGTITSLRDASGGIVPNLGAAELVASVPGLGEVAAIDARSPARLPSPSLTPDHLIETARQIIAGFADGFDGAVVIQGTDTIEESAFLLDLLIGDAKPVVVVGAMRGAEAPGADGPANLLAAALVAESEQARELGTLVVLNDEIHAARFVRKAHTALTSAFVSPLIGPIGLVAENRVRIHARVARTPTLPIPADGLAPVALVGIGMGDDGRLLRATPDLDFAGVVIEGMGAGHVPADVSAIVGAVAQRIPVVLASRCLTGPVFQHTYGYQGAEIDLITQGAVPAGILSAAKARLLLGLALRASPGRVGGAFDCYS